MHLSTRFRDFSKLRIVFFVDKREILNCFFHPRFLKEGPLNLDQTHVIITKIFFDSFQLCIDKRNDVLISLIFYFITHAGRNDEVLKMLVEE